MCGCLKKGTQKSDVQIANNRVFKNGIVYNLGDDLKLSANTQILINLHSLYEEYFILVKIINTPFEVYIESKSGKLVDYGFVFYGKYKSKDVIYVLTNDFNENIMEIL